MAIELLGSLVTSALLLGIILVVLLFVWALKPIEKKAGVRKNVKEDLKKIKDQINDE